MPAPNAATIHTLVETDPSITGVEVGRGYGGGFACTIYRRKPPHATRGEAATPAQAFRAACLLYLGDRAGDPIVEPA